MFLYYLQSLNVSGGQTLSSTIAFLTAMITPALLISATGSLVLSTSTRLGRVIDRVRELERRLAELITSENKDEIVLYERRVEAVFDLLDKVTTRSRLLQRAQFAFYAGLLIFVLTSLTIGAAGLLNDYAWLPIPVGLVGILCVFYGSILMMGESRLATATVNAEMDVTWEIANKIAPKEISSRYSYNRHGKRRFRVDDK